MSIYVTRTSQKLNFARLHLEQLEQAQASTGWSKHALVESLQESVLFHLASAYQAFLREIAERYRFDPGAIETFAGLSAQFDAAGLESPERTELAALEADESSWLNRMRQAYRACWQASDRRETAGGEQSRSEIQVRQINPSHAADADVFTECKRWFEALGRLVERLRAGMEEW